MCRRRDSRSPLHKCLENVCKHLFCTLIMALISFVQADAGRSPQSQTAEPMKYNERSFFLVRGNVSCDKIVGDRQSFVLCSDRGYLLKEITPSSTFLVCTGNSICPVKALLDLVDIPKEDIHRHITLSTPGKMQGHSVEDLKVKFRMGTKELDNAVQRAFLVCVSGHVYRMEYRFLLNVVSYVRSLKLTSSNICTELAIYNEVVQKWATSRVEGSVRELCVLFMMSCWESNCFEDWKQRLENILLEKVAAESVYDIIQSSDIIQEAKSVILDRIAILEKLTPQ